MFNNKSTAVPSSYSLVRVSRTICNSFLKHSKRFVRHEPRGHNNINFQFWKQDNHPVELRTIEMAHQKLDYIHYNPVEAGFVDKPEDYLYSSARDYYGTKRLIGIARLDNLIL